nr:MAG TPA: hypothetical protein [Caudoviricetes sp.]
MHRLSICLNVLIFPSYIFSDKDHHFGGLCHFRLRKVEISRNFQP